MNTHTVRTQLSLVTAALLLVTVANAREWSDSTGHYTLEATLIGVNEKTVIVQKKNLDLVAVPINKLSKVDKEFLKSKEATDAVRKSIDKPQIWTMQSGLKVKGTVLDYTRKDVTIQRRRGKIYVNDHLYDKLPGVYRVMIPKIVAHFEKTEFKDKKAFNTWMIRQKATPRTFTCDGVLLELESGDLYVVPFFFLSEDDRKILNPGWSRWIGAVEDREEQEKQALKLQAQAQAYQQDRQAKRQVMELQLLLQGYDAGLFSLWEVALYPGQNTRGGPISVVVPGRDSRQARSAAIRKYPGYVVGPIAKVRRKR